MPDNPLMRLRRLLLACLICMGVSLQGFAAVRAFEAPCPMAQAAADTVVESALPAGVSHDCCADADTFAKTGKMCKSGLTCQAAVQAPRFFGGLVATVSLAGRAVPGKAPGFESVDSSFVWRPPALI